MTVSVVDHGEGLGVVVGKTKARTMAEAAGFTRFERLDIKNPYQQVFLRESGEPKKNRAPTLHLGCAG